MTEENDTQQTSPEAVDLHPPCSDGLPPLTSAQWMFPLGGCDAKLSIVALPDCHIEPGDMDALAEIAMLMKKQLLRRAGMNQNDQRQETASK